MNIERRIDSKSDYLRRSALGLLGNRMPSWATVADALADGHRDTVMVRYKQANSPFMRADIPIGDASAVIDGLVAEGARRELLYLTWMSPSVGRRINGELWRGPGGLYLNYSTEQTHLRAGLDRSGRHAERAAARAVLEWACDGNSVADLMDLLDLYPDAVIEMTAYDREIGDIPGRNTIVWEVRNY